MEPEIFYSGLQWDQYLNSMRTNRDLVQRKQSEFRLPEEEQQRWRRSSKVAHVLVFTEDWCQNSVSALPPLLAIAEVASFDLRVMRRSERLPLQRALTGEVYPPVPLFIFFGDGWEELGRFVEMPRAFRQLKEDPAEAVWLKEMYDETWWQTELDELALMSKTEGDG